LALRPMASRMSSWFDVSSTNAWNDTYVQTVGRESR
jgi:hypothetical protein